MLAYSYKSTKTCKVNLIQSFDPFMKKTMFIMTHIGSDWELLIAALEKAPQIQVFNTGNFYHHPDDVRRLTNNRHRRNNSSAIWIDLLFYNKDFTLKRLSQYYKFIYWTSSFEKACPQLLSVYDRDHAEAYYRFRIEGIRQYAKRTSGFCNPDLQSDTFLDTILG